MSIIAWLLGLLGVSGAGIGIAVMLGGGPMLLGIAGKVIGFVKGLSPKARLCIAAAVALVVGAIWHQSHAHKAIRDAWTAGYNYRANEDAKALAVLRARVATTTAQGVKIAQEERTKNDTDNRNIRAAADTLSLRGPGAARCRPVGNPAAPTAASEHEPANRPGDAADGGLPVADGQGDLAAVPWRWLVANAEECDLNRAEALAWRDADARQRAEWEKLRNAKPAH